MAFDFLPLRFEYSELAPAMSEDSARWHHDVVHGGYLDKINRLIDPYPQLAGLTIEELLGEPERIPASIRSDVRFFGAGHSNHQFMWKILGRPDGSRPAGALAAALDATFGGFEPFCETFAGEALALKGVGWAFLSLSAPRVPELEIIILPDNGNVLELKKPGVLICDLWEHAYLTDHGLDRNAWLDGYFKNVDWATCTTRYDCLVAGRPTP